MRKGTACESRKYRYSSLVPQRTVSIPQPSFKVLLRKGGLLTPESCSYAAETAGVSLLIEQ